MMLFVNELKWVLERSNQFDQEHENFHQTKKY